MENDSFNSLSLISFLITSLVVLNKFNSKMSDIPN
jgi:hypothetical protein